MANSFYGDIIILDTFTVNILLSTYLTSRGPYRLNSIEWQKPTTIDHTAVIYDSSGTDKNPLFDEVCVVAKQSLVKYYFGLRVRDVYIVSGEVGSGKIIVLLNPLTA